MCKNTDGVGGKKMKNEFLYVYMRLSREVNVECGNPATGLTETMDKICRIVILPEKYSDVRSAYEEIML